jgi:large subunit ribosomal protein L24e
MVVKRSCSFCAGEIEPGTGTMFIKRDGAVFHFCSSSCRKQQLHLGRVGHRLKWTRAHVVKRQTEQSSAAGKAAGRAKATAGRPGSKPAASAPVAPPKESAAPVEAPPAETVAPTPSTGKSAEAPKDTPSPAPPARKPRTKKPKEPAAST